jgi:septal ring factor EnvC (AmiA/AmiB activator)
MENLCSIFEKLTIAGSKLREQESQITKAINEKFEEIDEAQKTIIKRSTEIKDLQKTQSDLETTLASVKEAEKNLVENGTLLLKVLEESSSEVERIMKP